VTIVFGSIDGSSLNINSLLALRMLQRDAAYGLQSRNRLSPTVRIGPDGLRRLNSADSLRATLAALDAETSSNQRASDQAGAADAALAQVSDLLTRAKALVGANANISALSADEKAANQLEIDSILASLDSISQTTSFNHVHLLDGSATLKASGKSLKIDSAATTDIGKTDVNGTSYSLADLKSGKALSTIDGNISAAADAINRAIGDISTQRATIGAFDQHTLQTRLIGIASSREQMLSTISLIQNGDYTLEISRRWGFPMPQQSSLFARGQINRRSCISTFSILG
jgi:flagellin-like hook-associated protein FlgL